MPLITVPETTLRYYLLNYDAQCRERSELCGELGSDILASEIASGQFTDIFLFSHGWLGDIPAAQAQYNRWVRAMAMNDADMQAMKSIRKGFRPLLIGLHWPSLPWGDERVEGQSDSDLIESFVSTYSERISDSPAAREALRTIIDEAIDNLEPDELSTSTIDAYTTLNDESGLGTDGSASAPGDDRDTFDPQALYLESEEVEGDILDSTNDLGILDSGASIILNRVFAPLRTLSFWRMKKRAVQFGELGVHRLLNKLQDAGSPDLRFHLVGHSFGCVAMSGAVRGPHGGGDDGLLRAVDSLSLIQGALSLWSFCAGGIPEEEGKSGYFYPICRDRLVAGPIVTTQSEHDTAVGKWYQMASGIAMGSAGMYDIKLPRYGAVGTYGLQGMGISTKNASLLSCQDAYNFEAGSIYNLEGSRFITKITDRFGGAHNSIDEPEVAHAIWMAAMGEAS
jgi:hypothetical protein